MLACEPVTLLEKIFDSEQHKTLPLDRRVGITRHLEAFFERVVEKLRPAIIAEIGAYEADFSRRMRKACPGSSLFAFEGNPRVFERFSEEVRHCGVDYQHLAIGRAEGTAVFHIPEQIANVTMPYAGRMGSLRNVARDDSTTTTVEVPMSTLDAALLKAGNAGGGIALWIDVEGAVDQVLDGGLETLENTQIIMCELERAPFWTNQALDKSIRLRLEAAGFRLVARDCQKWFQYNAVFVKESLLARDTELRELINNLNDTVLDEWLKIIPCVLFQYWDKVTPPAEVSELMKSWESDHSFTYLRFNHEKSVQFIADLFCDDVKRAYEECKVPAMQADFFRLCALYAFSGVYVDADIRNLGRNEFIQDRSGRGFLFVRQNKLANDLMAVHQRRDPAIAYALRMAIENIQQRRGTTVWEITGPGILTEAYHRLGPSDPLFSGFKIGHVREVRTLVQFNWDLEYKKSDTHWTNVKTALPPVENL